MISKGEIAISGKNVLGEWHQATKGLNVQCRSQTISAKKLIVRVI